MKKAKQNKTKQVHLFFFSLASAEGMFSRQLGQ